MIAQILESVKRATAPLVSTVGFGSISFISIMEQATTILGFVGTLVGTVGAVLSLILVVTRLKHLRHTMHK